MQFWDVGAQVVVDFATDAAVNVLMVLPLNELVVLVDIYIKLYCNNDPKRRSYHPLLSKQ